MGMAQVLGTLVVAVAVIGRRTSTRPLQSAQSVLHFVLGTAGVLVLLFDVMAASGVTTLLLSRLRLFNIIAAGALLLLVFALAPFFQTEAEKQIEREARQIKQQQRSKIQATRGEPTQKATSPENGRKNMPSERTAPPRRVRSRRRKHRCG